MSNRYFLFGYQYDNKGEIKPHPTESRAVQDIFSMYLEGKSLKSIAEKMIDSSIPYRDDLPVWNKHIVKRLLENKKFIGGDGYPPIISISIFNKVKEKKEKKANNAITSPILPLKPLLYCKKCSTQMIRKKPGLLFCPTCLNAYDEIDILKKIKSKEKTLSDLEFPTDTLKITIQDSEKILELEKSINTAVAENKDVAQIKDKIYRMAALRFENAGQADNIVMTEIIKEKLSKDKIELKEITKRILIGKEVHFELKNEIIL